jgi:hypothetical protein
MRDLGVKAKEALSTQPGTCSSCRFWAHIGPRKYGECENDMVRDQCEEPPFWSQPDFSCKFYTPQPTATEEASK